MFSQLCIHASLSFAMASAAATASTTTSTRIGDDEERLTQGRNNGDSSATARSPFVPDKIADISDPFAHVEDEGVKQSLRPILQEMEARNKPAKKLHNPVRGTEDGPDRAQPDTTTTILNASLDLGILDISQAPNGASSTREHRRLEPAVDCDDSYPLINASGNAFRNLIDACLNGFCPYDGPIGCWDTRFVTDMSVAFYDQIDFDEDISDWDTGNVKNMESMFVYASNFNKPVGAWDTKKVTSMKNMFYYAFKFNQPVGEWDTKRVRDMEGMFTSCYEFKSDVSDWNTSLVTSMKRMFQSAYEFNYAVGDWNTENVKDMKNMFFYAKNFDKPVGDWVTSSVTDMSSMFNRAYRFNQFIGNWDVSNISNMNFLFLRAYSFNKVIGNWETSGVTTMYRMFYQAESFNRPVDDWDVSGVTDFRQMFYSAVSFNQCILTWADKVPDIVSTTDMLENSACPINGNPKPGFAPWCLDTCSVASCKNNPIQFSFTADTSCDDLANLSQKTVKDLCELPWDIAENCPELCPGTEECPCTDSILPFSGTSCASVADLKKKKRKRKCDNNQAIADNCPGVCTC